MAARILIPASLSQMSIAIWHNEYAAELFEAEASPKDHRPFSPFLLPQHGDVV
jgi:hypothetical protein